MALVKASEAKAAAAVQNAAKAIDREAGLADEATGLRVLHVVYGKNSLDLGRRTASAPSMQSCPSALRRELCRALYHESTSSRATRR